MFVQLSVVLVIPNVCNVVNTTVSWLFVCYLLKLVDVCDDGFMQKPM